MQNHTDMISISVPAVLLTYRQLTVEIRPVQQPHVAGQEVLGEAGRGAGGHLASPHPHSE